MGPGIIIPLVVIAIVVPVGLTWAKHHFKDGGDEARTTSDPSVRLTSTALRGLDMRPWRVVYEVAADRLDGIDHVVIGPAGIFAIVTSMEPIPDEPTIGPSARDVSAAAIRLGAVDDALTRCAMSSDALVTVHWGAPDRDVAAPPSMTLLPGSVAVDGRRLDEWLAGLSGSRLTPAQVDLAWQTLVVAIGRPDPL
jgi:hypothetical protein